jgi:5'-nucleotidase
MTDKRQPLILITNDDGIHSPGLHAAARALEVMGELLIVAPAKQQSGMGRSMPPIYEGSICRQMIQLNYHEIEGYCVDGSPAQVVQHGIIEIAPRRPDLIVSGINYGENIGSGITVSGTVGAAMEGADNGIPALAVSQKTAPEHFLHPSDAVDMSVAAHFLQFFAKQTLETGLPPGVDLLKIDVPQFATPQTPWRWTRMSRQRYFYPVKPHRRRPTDPGPMGFEIRVDLSTLEPDSDIRAATVDGVVSVTPLTLDLTAKVEPPLLERWGARGNDL